MMNSAQPRPTDETLPAALLPQPQSIRLTGGTCALPEQGFIVLNAPDPQPLRGAARQLQAALAAPGTAGAGWEVVASAAGVAGTCPIALNLVPGGAAHAQGYSLTATPSGVEAVAASPAGLFYAVQTLCQIVSLYGRDMPTFRCDDWPDFPQRGAMLDVSRDRVPTMATMFDLVDLFASLKLNQLQLYTEHTFAYRAHPSVWADASPFTGEEILALDAYCRERFIELVPNQNTFGHMRRWLTKAAYRDLAEAPDGCETRWGRFDEPFSLNPDDPRSLELVRSLLDELLPHFSSRQVNVGLDETVDLGQGRSKAAVGQRGVGPVFLDFLLKIHREVKRRGRTMQFWGDIIMEHPELTPLLPRDALALEWGYEADHPFDEHGAHFAASGVAFYVCPGTSSWNSVAGRTDNALANLRNAAENGRRHGAVGYLITDWGDNGHWQPLSASFLPWAYGAGLAWAYATNAETDVVAAADRFIFADAAGLVAQAAYDLGNVFQPLKLPVHNNSILFLVLHAAPEALRAQLGPDPDFATLRARFAYVQQEIEAIAVRIGGSRMARPDAALVQAELLWAADLLRHACRRALWLLDGWDPGAQLHTTAPAPAELAADAGDLIARYDTLWHARSRLGGFADSVARLRTMGDEYRA